jgi:hypothetical protein
MFEKSNDPECGAGLSNQVYVTDQFEGRGRLSVKTQPSTKAHLPHLKRLSRRSGGPKTAQGKAKASKNSIDHGAYAVKRPETDSYYAYAELIHRELRPIGPLQQEMADSAAYDAFKSMRLREIERRDLLRAEQEQVSTKKLAELTGFPWADTHHELLAEPINQALLQKSIHRSWRSFAAPKGDVGSPEGRSTPDRMVVELYDEGCKVLSSPGLVQFIEEGFFARLDVVMLEARTQQNYLGRRIHEQRSEMLLVQYWLYRNAARVSQCIHKLHDDKIVDVLSDERIVRAKAHVSNSLRNNIATLAALKGMKGRDLGDVYRSIEQAANKRLRYDEP